MLKLSSKKISETNFTCKRLKRLPKLRNEQKLKSVSVLDRNSRQLKNSK